ncbi:unnamed protein product, partial [Rotaria magnacalcarata]
EGVSKYNSIEFNLKRTLSSSKRTTTISTLSPLDIEITTWRAFTIGNAKTFQLSNFKSSVTNIVPLEFEDGALSIDNSWKSEESSTRTNMLLLDQAKTMFKSLTENDTHRSSITLQNFNTIQDVNDKITNILSKGWALSLSKTNTRFTELQKKYLNDACIKGEETGFK